VVVEVAVLLLSLETKKGGNSFPRKKIGTFMAGIGSGILKKWREHTF
jgi:hypothetical protein